MFATLAGVSLFAQTVVPFGALAATYSQELQDAYDWAYWKGVTTMSPIDNANMYGAITRSEMAKMLSVYSTEVLGKTPDTSAACTFTDIDSVKGDLHDYIIESCQLGIMGQGITAFRPYDTISRAEFGTALSRVLWGSENEGGTPYYAKHLDALKAAGIMNQIANAESTKEIRGYVMLMLMRSETNAVDCKDPVIALACLDPEADMYKECPAACREDASKDGNGNVVKSGDLAVTAKATEGRKARVPGVSDLDTLTFKTSEDVTITKVVLERYGYSTQDDVDEVRLEDQDGNVIADGKSLTKDKVTLSIKKDYRSVDGTYLATVVAKLTGNNVGGTIGFKVVDVESTAKNLNVDDYTPYTYDMVQYSGSTVTVDIKGTDNKNYNYVEGESYEIARLKVKAGSSIIYLKGFTLTNDGTLDMADFLDKLTVKADGKEVEGLKFSVNKDDQLVITFDDMTIDMNKSALFVISASFKDFDDYGKTVAYYLEKDSDINAVEKKTWARLTVDGARKKANAVHHAFNGGKIKLSNNKLGKIDASQGSEDVVVAEGSIKVTEPISKLGFTLEADGTGKDYVTAVRMFVGDEEFEAKKSGTTFTFSNVEIAESADIQFKVDIKDDDNAQSKEFTLKPNFNGDAFKNARYDNSRDDVNTGDVSGTISFSQVTIQAARATLKNTLSDSAEFLNDDTNEGEVFKGTYTAKKALINLNKFYMSGAANPDKVKITYYLYVNGDEVASVDAYGTGAEETFDDVEVKAGQSVDIKVVAEVEAYGSGATLSGIQLVLGGTDEFGKDVEYKAAKLVDIKIVDKWSIKVEAGASRNTVLRTSNNQTLAEFSVKSSSSTSTELTDLVFTIAGGTGAEAFTKDDVDASFDIDDCTEAGGVFTCEDMKLKLPQDVTISFNTKKQWEYTLTLNSVNDKTQSRKFSKRFEKALVTIKKQENKGDETEFTLGVSADNDVTVSNAVLTYSGGTIPVNDEFSDGETVSTTNSNDSAQYITEMAYDWEDWDGNTWHVSILKSAYQDYFKVWSTSDYAKVFKAKD